MNTAVEAEAQAIIRDAMRYRFLRKAPSGVQINSWPRSRKEKLDEAIDDYLRKYEGWNSMWL